MTADPKANGPIIVTRREVERILVREGAESAIGEAAVKANDMERAQAMAMMGAILRELRRTEAEHGSPDVLVAPDHGPASRLQSLIASGQAGTLSLAPLPAGGLEAKFDTWDWGGWATVAWAKLKNPIPHPIIRPTNPTPAPLPDRARIGVLGDWGTGLYGAPRIAEAVRNDPDPYALLLHLGDVYYAGSENEVQRRFLDLWPRRPEAMHRALNSNHEMYSGGVPYFTMTIPAFRQDASYFALQNEHWVLVGLDLAYVEHAIDDQQAEWLRGILNQAGRRRIVLFSHHQLFSSFESQGDKLWAHPVLAEILASGRVFAWYWGHEHTCSIYEADEGRTGLLGRCIGHGGMPESRKKSRGLPPATGFGMNGGDWRQVPARMKNGSRLAPPSVILEGPNPLITGEEDDFTPHGFGVLTLEGPRLTEEVRDANGMPIYRRQLA
jgi:hypothetical protein